MNLLQKRPVPVSALSSLARRGALLLAVGCAVPAHAATVAPPAPAPLLSASPNDAELLLKSLEDRLGGNPFDPVSMNNLAVIRLKENNPYAAAELLARATQLDPDNTVIADNNKRLGAWIDARAKAQNKPAEPLDDPSQPFPPEPPPLWQSR